MARVLLQFRLMCELMKKSWLRRYCRGDASEDALGLRIIPGVEHPGGRKLFDEVGYVICRALFLLMIDVPVVSNDS